MLTLHCNTFKLEIRFMKEFQIYYWPGVMIFRFTNVLYRGKPIVNKYVFKKDKDIRGSSRSMTLAF